MERIRAESINRKAVTNEGVLEMWNYYHLREYLLSLGRGKDFTESTDHYSESLELSSIWHGTYDRLRRNASNTQSENVSIIGVDNQARQIVLQVIPVEGEDREIPSELNKEQRIKTREKGGADVILGDIHAHPEIYEWQYGNQKGKFSHIGSFSVPDFWSIIGPSHDYLMGLVHGDENFLAFRTRESGEMDGLTYLPFFKRNRDSFIKFWYTKRGMTYLPKEKAIVRLNLQGEKGRLDDIELLNLNLDIARKHHLVIYRGKENETLRRIFPETNV